MYAVDGYRDDVTSLLAFRRQLKTVLFRQSYSD